MFFGKIYPSPHLFTWKFKFSHVTRQHSRAMMISQDGRGRHWSPPTYRKGSGSPGKTAGILFSWTEIMSFNLWAERGRVSRSFSHSVWHFSRSMWAQWVRKAWRSHVVWRLILGNDRNGTISLSAVHFSLFVRWNVTNHKFQPLHYATNTPWKCSRSRCPQKTSLIIWKCG